MTAWSCIYKPWIQCVANWTVQNADHRPLFSGLEGVLTCIVKTIVFSSLQSAFCTVTQRPFTDPVTNRLIVVCSRGPNR